MVQNLVFILYSSEGGIEKQSQDYQTHRQRPEFLKTYHSQATDISEPWLGHNLSQTSLRIIESGRLDEPIKLNYSLPPHLLCYEGIGRGDGRYPSSDHLLRILGLNVLYW